MTEYEELVRKYEAGEIEISVLERYLSKKYGIGIRISPNEG